MHSLDGAHYDLAQRVDERLEDVAGVDGAEHTTPQVQTVDKLPVIHRLVCLLENTITKHTHTHLTLDHTQNIEQHSWVRNKKERVCVGSCTMSTRVCVCVCVSAVS